MKHGPMHEEALSRFRVYESELLDWLAKCRLPVDEFEDYLLGTYAKLVNQDFRDVSAGNLREILFGALRKTVLDEAANPSSELLGRPPKDLPVFPKFTSAFVEPLSDNEILSCHLRAIQGLPDRCRRVFTLRKVYSYSHDEIAKRLKISVEVVAQDLVLAARECWRAEQAAVRVKHAGNPTLVGRVHKILRRRRRR